MNVHEYLTTLNWQKIDRNHMPVEYYNDLL
jgi:hypothetical protein